MLKIRVSYTEEKEVNDFIKKLEKDFYILQVSKAYSNRGGVYRRKYIEVLKKI